MSFTNQSNGRRTACLIAALAGLVLSGAAVAQQASSSSSSSGRQGTTTTTTTSSDGSRSFSFSDQRDGKNVVIEMQNDRVTRAEFDGKPVPPERVVREGNTIILKNEGGDVLYEHEFHEDAGTPMPSPRMHSWVLQPEGVRMAPRARVSGTASSQKSMIGVRLGEVDQALRRHFGLKPGEATMIYSVSVGLPADQAGLNAYDVIIGIDGKSPANEEFVRATLREKDPGQAVSVTVIQRGQNKTLTITPEKYDRERLDKTKQKPVAGLLRGEDEEGLFPGAFGWASAAPGLAALDELHVNGALDEDAEDEVKRAIEEAYSWKFHVDEEGNVVTDDEPGDAVDGADQAARERKMHGLLRRMAPGHPLVGKVFGPNGQSRAEVFVSPDTESAADYYRNMADWEEQRATLMRELEEQQRDMAERMRALHTELHQLRQRTRTPNQPATPVPPAEPAAPAPPAPGPGAGAAKS